MFSQERRKHQAANRVIDGSFIIAFGCRFRNVFGCEEKPLNFITESGLPNSRVLQRFTEFRVPDTNRRRVPIVSQNGLNGLREHRVLRSGDPQIIGEMNPGIIKDPGVAHTVLSVAGSGVKTRRPRANSLIDPLIDPNMRCSGSYRDREGDSR